MHLIRSGSLTGFSELIRELGENPIAIMHELNINEAIFRNPNTYMSFNKVAEILNLAAVRCQQPLLGLMLVQRQTLTIFGLSSQILNQQPTVQAAISNINNYLHIHAQGIQIKQKEENGRVSIIMGFGFHCPIGHNSLIQMCIGHLFIFVSNLLLASNVKVGLHLTQHLPHNSQLNNFPINFPEMSFTDSFDGLSFPAEYLKYDLVQNDGKVAEDALRQEVFGLYPNNTQFQIKELMDRLLPTGECNLDVVASSLDVHPRVLQNRLKAMDTTFSRLLKETRLEIAMQYLLNDALSVTDLALKLGYAEVAIFSRNFKTWTGLSPMQWQRAHKIK